VTGVSKSTAGVTPSPNIWRHTATYETECRAFDRDGLVDAAVGPLDELTVVDIGCGTGFSLPRLATSAARVVGVEPHPPLVALARRRTRSLANVEVLEGGAESLPLPDGSVDVAHARWAYFFGPGCEPGLAELDRVVRRGGRAFVIDNDPTRSTFGRWFARGYPSVDHESVERFWSTQGWTRTEILTSLDFDSRADLEAVIRIEFAPALADELLASYDGRRIDYAVNVWSRSY
jgi:SAM-dependent methyltransferase